MARQPKQPAFLDKFKPDLEQRNRSVRKNARLELFAALWTGTIGGTLALCKAEGVDFSAETAARYLRDPKFIDLMREHKAMRPGSGVWTREELQRFLTRVAAGIEPEGTRLVTVREAIIPREDDYDDKIGGYQYRLVDREEPYYPKMADRIKAADLLGRTMGAFIDRVDVSGQVSVVDLLDDDLRHAKPVLDASPPVLTLEDNKSDDLFS